MWGTVGTMQLEICEVKVINGSGLSKCRMCGMSFSYAIDGNVRWSVGQTTTLVQTVI